jgi:hypothetical protein
MKFERGNNPKKTLRVGKYSNLIKVHQVIQEIRGGQTTCFYLPDSIAEMFMEELANGVRIIPSGIRLPDGLLRQEYRLEVEYPEGGTGNHTADIRGTSVEFTPTGKIYDIPEELEEKVYEYTF